MAIKTSKGKENYYARYKASGQYAKNRKMRLERALKKNPENEQIVTALKDIVYRRKKPSTKAWSSSARAFAELSREMTACGNAASNQPKKLRLHNEAKNAIQIKRPFSIEARLKGYTV